MFGRLFGKSSTGKQKEEAPRLNPDTAESIFNAVGPRSIPTMPSAAQKAFQLSTDPSAEARDFVEVIESDEALSARVIKIANSVFFDRGNPSKTIEESVTKIGINELRSLLSATTLSEIFPSNQPVRGQAWANDIATALISRTLAQRLFPGKEDTAFLGGLMHDIGKLLLIQRASEEYRQVLAKVEKDGEYFHKAEELTFPFDHTQVGQLIGEKWNFSADLISIIRDHHAPWPDSPSPDKLTFAYLIKAADLFAHSLGFGHPAGFHRLKRRAEEDLGPAWAMVGIPEQDRRQTLAQFQKIFDLEFDLYRGGQAQ